MAQKDNSERSNPLFDDFGNKNLLDGFDAAKLDQLKKAAFIMPSNMEYIRDMLQVGWVTGQLSSAGPIPNSGQIVTTTDLGANATTTLFEPDNGEVWVICTLSGQKAGGVTTANFQFYLEDAAGNKSYLCDFNGTSGAIPINEGGFVTPIYFDNNAVLKVSTTLIAGSYGTITATAQLMRVR